MYKYLYRQRVNILIVFFFIISCGSTVSKKKYTPYAIVQESDLTSISFGQVVFKYIPAQDEPIPNSVFLTGPWNKWNVADENYRFVFYPDGSYRLNVFLYPGSFIFKLVFDGNKVDRMDKLSGELQPVPTYYIDDDLLNTSAVLEVRD